MSSKTLSLIALLVFSIVLIDSANSSGLVSPKNLLDKLFKPPTSLKLNGTEMVDKLLANLQKTIKDLKLDPLKTLPIDLPGLSLRNGTINGLSNIQRVGDVTVDVGLLQPDTRIKSAFAIVNVSTDEDIKFGGKQGHVHTLLKGVSAHTVYKIDLLTQMLTLSKFDLSIGDYKYNVTGLGKEAEAGGKTFNTIVAVLKDPIAKGISTTLQVAINAVLLSAKTAMIAG